jgi:hypothetical protein
LSAKHVIIPHYFPEHQETAPLSPKFTRLTKQEAWKLRDAGLLQCVNPLRRLWRWIEPTTHSNKLRSRGRVSTEIPLSLQGIISREIARQGPEQACA